MMDPSLSKVKMQSTPSSTASRKRPAPSLLPAWEPSSSSSSPALPRPAKRQARNPTLERNEAYRQYPSPIPTSTTGIFSSSPPPIHPRPGLRRTQSVVSERAPLSAVHSVTLSEDGQKLLMGRSSNSSHYQLSANRLISRVHVEARYIAATLPLEQNKVQIVCKGWNGLQLHCQGQTWELAKGDSFTSETESADIMLDAQDARVLILWPQKDTKESLGSIADSLCDDDNSPRGRNAVTSTRGQPIAASPLRRDQRLRSPESPTPAGQPVTTTNLDNLLPQNAVEAFVQVYEDVYTPENEDVAEVPSQTSTKAATSVAGIATQSSLSDLDEPENDPDEENDPVVHAFGPFGADIASRMASVTTYTSPEAPGRRVRDPTASSPTGSDSDTTKSADFAPVVNHFINQLAFSRLSSTPLSMIMNNLPATLKQERPTQLEGQSLTLGDLQKLLNGTPCIGEIHREGKDAAGKRLESEYYYVPDGDTDEQRRAAVVDGLRKPSLRNCRKQHKQYYWKKPRAP